MLRITLVVVTWNQPKLVRKCVETIAAAIEETSAKIDLRLVNNGGNAETTDLLHDLPLPAMSRLVHLDRNMGYAGALNHALSQIELASGDYTVIMNDDVSVPTNFFVNLDAHIREMNKPALVGFPISEAIQSGSGVTYAMRYWPTASYASPLRSVPSFRSGCHYWSLDYPCGAIIACRNSFLDNVGGIPAQNFLYFEELNLVKAAMGCGDFVSICDSVLIRHIGGASTANLPSRRSAAFYSTVAALRFSLKHYPVLLPLVLIIRAMFACLKALQTKTFMPAHTFLLAAKEFLSNPRKSPLQ